MADRTCSTDGCDRALGGRNKSGLCRPCLGRRAFHTPEARVKAVAGIRRALADPIRREAYGARSAANLARWRSTPEGAATLREVATANLAKAQQCDEKLRRHRIRAAFHAGIPEHRWDEAVKLASSHMTAAEAKRIIMDDEAAIERRRIAALTPFERQMEVAARVGIVVKQDFRTGGPSYTLGGVAPEAI